MIVDSNIKMLLSFSGAFFMLFHLAKEICSGRNGDDLTLVMTAGN
jgi:hypothetical protein